MAPWPVGHGITVQQVIPGSSNYAKCFFFHPQNPAGWQKCCMLGMLAGMFAGMLAVFVHSFVCTKCIAKHDAHIDLFKEAFSLQVQID